MICIACSAEKKELAKSHVISKFVRMRLAGEIGSDGRKRYKFKWVDRSDLPRQDLPKPNLMCKECDSMLGSAVERDAPSLLMPDDVESFEDWEKLPIKPTQISGIFEDPLWLGVYEYFGEQKTIIEKFSLSTAWRALHSMNKDGRNLSRHFLSTERGATIDSVVKRYLFDNLPLDGASGAYLYYMGPKSVTFISNNEDELPIAWAEVGENEEFLGVAVMFAYWVILWPLFDRSPTDYFDKLERLEKICFLDWVSKIKSELAGVA